MMYTRAQGADFDSWKTDGWYAKDMMPLCKKLETFHQDEPGINKDAHGYDGPIHVSDGGFRSKSEKQFMETVKKMGYKEEVDLQNLDTVDGFSRWQRYVSPEGKRQDAAHTFIHPLLQDGEHQNLHILCNSKVVRVLFDTSDPPRAIGIEYKPNENQQPVLNTSKPVHKVVKASKLVVVSAGALGSPQVLERSGIGNPDLLKRLGVPLVSDLPAVGEQYQDHHLILYPYRSTLPAEETVDGLLSGRVDFAKAVAEKNPMLGWNAIGKPDVFPPVLSTDITQTSAPNCVSRKEKSSPSVQSSRKTGNAISHRTQRAQSCCALC
jgi:alcohol oxidase